jgi:TP901 family phage tail tape measure protein
MAKRTIATRLVVEGVDEYKRSVKDASAEIKQYKSALELVENQYKENANSLEALSKKNQALNDLIKKQENSVRLLAEAVKSAEAAQSAYASKIEDVKAKLAAAQEEQRQLGERTDENAAAYDEITKKISEYQQELARLEAGHTKAKGSATKWQTQLNYAQKDLDTLNADLAKNTKYLEEAQSSTDQCATSIDRYGKEIKDAGDETKNTNAALDTLAAALIAGGVKRGFEELVEVLRACVDAAIEFESAITGVYKTVDGTDEQLSAISNGIKELSLSIPATTTELAAVAEAAGQLGIKTEDILSFTEVMTNLGVATDLTADQAAVLLAQFANITGMDPADFSRLGSTIVALGNNFATTESKITDMAQGMASAASMAGMSEAEILALATSLSSLGTEAQAGSSAMSKLIKELQTAVETGNGLENFASVAGMSASQFKVAWGESAVGALNAFIQGLNDTERNGASAIVVLEKMGLTETRLSNSILKLASSGTTLTDALKTANTAWAQNSALQEEAEKRYQTTESRMVLLGNAANNLKIAIGEQLTPVLNKLADAGTAALQWATDFVRDNPQIVALIGAAASALGVLAAAVAGVVLWTKLAVPAIEAFNAALASNPYGLAALALSALIAGISALVLLMPDATSETDKLLQKVEETAAAYDELNEKMQQEKSSVSSLMAQIAQLSSIENKSAAEKAKLSELVNQLNAAVPDLALAYNEEADALNMSTEAIKARIKAQQDAADYENQVKRLIELEQEQLELEEQLAEQQELLAEHGAGRYFSMGAWEDYGYTENIERLTQAIAENQAQQEALNVSVNSYASARAAAATQEEEALAPYQASVVAIQELQAEMTALEAKYMEAYEAAYNSISQQMGLWENMGETGKTSAQTLNEALESQIKYLEDYSNNLNSLLGRNIEGIEEFAMLFSDGSQESAAALAGLADASDEEIIQIIQNLKKVEEGKQEFSDRFAEMSTDFDAKMDEISGRLTEAVEEMNRMAEAAEAGVQTVQGFIDGAKSKEAEVRAQYERLGRIATEGYKSALDIHSPSKVMMELGRFTVQGLTVGIEQEQKNMERATLDAADTARRAAEKAIPVGYQNSITNSSQVFHQNSVNNHQTVIINSRDPLSPSEIARESKNALRRMSWS